MKESVKVTCRKLTANKRVLHALYMGEFQVGRCLNFVIKQIKTFDHLKVLQRSAVQAARGDLSCRFLYILM